MPSEPLSRYPAMRTSRIDEFAHGLRAIYGATGFSLTDGSALAVRANFVRLHDIALGFSSLGTAVTVNFREEDFALLQLPLRGQGATKTGRESVAIRAAGACLTSPGRPTTIERGAYFEQLFLRVSSSALRRRLELLLGMPIRREIEFVSADFTSPSMLAGLQRMIHQFVIQLDDEQALLSPLALGEMEQAIILQLLFASRHNFSPMLEREPLDPALSYLRRAEDYIEANWSRPILIDDLVEIAGVSARSLFKGFEKVHGCPPMTFVKRVRLRHARDRLASPDLGTTVTGVALACGFSNLGHFANDYRAAFGERPLETLRRSKAS